MEITKCLVLLTLFKEGSPGIHRKRENPKQSAYSINKLLHNAEAFQSFSVPKAELRQPRGGDLRLTGSNSWSNPLALAADPETHCLAEIICIEPSFRPLFQQGDTMRCVTAENQLSYILAVCRVLG